MKYLKSFKEKWDFRQKCKEIDKLCERYSIKNYTINKDLSIDVNGDVNLERMHRDDLPLHVKHGGKLPIKFNNISGDFNCYAIGLQSLENCPKSIGGVFNADFNYLTSLVGSPETIGNLFTFRSNQVTSFEGSPKQCGDIDCSHNQITSFEGIPKSSWIIFTGNPIDTIYQLIGDCSKIELFNDYDIIQGNEIMFDRLNDFLKEIGKLKGSQHPGLPKTAPVIKEIEKYYKIIY